MIKSYLLNNPGEWLLGMQMAHQIWEKSLATQNFFIYGGTRFEATPIY
jgi:hypothetical protein